MVKVKSTKITNKQLYDKMIELDRRLIRIEKLVLLLIDDELLSNEEKARVEKIEQMVRNGNIDQLSEEKFY